MLKIEKTSVVGLEPAIRGMRNPLESGDKSDSFWSYSSDVGNSIYQVGENDHDLMMRLAKGGPVHAKYRRMIVVYLDITAPLYWWKEFDTYRVGVAPNPTDIEMNSCSTMHRITAKEFTTEDFSCEHLISGEEPGMYIFGYTDNFGPRDVLALNIRILNLYRKKYIEATEMLKNEIDEASKKSILEKRKQYWWQIIQLLPTSYNQRRTVKMNYEVLANIYGSRRNHKLDEWHVVCDWIQSLPYSDIITLGK